MSGTDPPPLDRAAEQTYERALRLLAARPRSARALGQRLRQKGEPEEAVRAVIARLLANGLLDDARFAASRARVGVLDRSRSRRRVAETLAKDGVEPAVADAAIREVLDEDGGDELASALRAGEKKLRTLARLDARSRRDKLYGYLARQGYRAETVRVVLRRLLDAPPPESTED